MVGGQDELVFDGGSMFINFEGTIEVIGTQFTEELLIYDLYEQPNPQQNKSFNYSTNSIDINLDDNNKQKIDTPKSIQESDILEDQILQALLLGTKDYVEKTGFSNKLCKDIKIYATKT